MLPIWKAVQWLPRKPVFYHWECSWQAAPYSLSLINMAFFKLSITIFNSIIVLSCCYLEVLSSFGKLSEAARRTGFPEALLLPWRSQLIAYSPLPRREPLLLAAPQWPAGLAFLPGSHHPPCFRDTGFIAVKVSLGETYLCLQLTITPASSKCF